MLHQTLPLGKYVPLGWVCGMSGVLYRKRIFFLFRHIAPLPESVEVTSSLYGSADVISLYQSADVTSSLHQSADVASFFHGSTDVTSPLLGRPSVC